MIFGQDYPPPTDLITVPTAGTLVRGSFSMDMRIQDEGGMVLGLSAGITDRFQFGLSYGSPNLIGDDSLIWYPRPEAKLKYLLIGKLPRENFEAKAGTQLCSDTNLITWVLCHE